MPAKSLIKKMRGGGGGGSLAPASYANTGVQLTPGGIKTLPNTVSDPNYFSNSAAKVAGRGCAGTRLKTVAAQGMYKPYSSMKGGSNLVRLQRNPLVSTVTGPSAGYAAIGPGSLFNAKDLTNLESLGAGPVAGIGLDATKNASPITGGRSKRRSKRCCTRRSCKCNKHKKGRKKTRKHSSRKRRTRRNVKRRRSRRSRRSYRGGAPQPYSNQPITHGYGVGAPFNNNQPVYKNSAMANPPPYRPYDNCDKNNFINKNNMPANKQISK